MLQPNDLSLPFGGLFDVLAQWAPSHHEHRVGREININRAPIVFIPDGSELIQDVLCESDIEFVEAVNKILIPVPGQPPSIGPGGAVAVNKTAVLCEENYPRTSPPVIGRKHIDVTSIRAKQTTP